MSNDEIRKKNYFHKNRSKKIESTQVNSTNPPPTILDRDKKIRLSKE